MTDDQRQGQIQIIKEKWKAAYGDATLFYLTSYTDIPTLISMMTESDAENRRLEEAVEEMKADLFEQNQDLSEIIVKQDEEIERLEARAEALERALRESSSCQTCVNMGTVFNSCDLCDGDFIHWKFNEARFAAESGANE